MPDFTPGPWVVEKDNLHPFFYVSKDKSKTFLATVNNEANARLMAAAPELVKELYYALGYIVEAHGIATDPHYKNIAWNDIQRIQALLTYIHGTEDTYDTDA